MNKAAMNNAAMKFDVNINGRAARLSIDGTRFQYRRDGEEAIERAFSIEPAGPGLYSVLIEGRVYTISYPPLEKNHSPLENLIGEMSVNGRGFSVEVFDPRELRARKSAAEGGGRLNIAALMPGKVIRLLVEKGQQVETGQGLIVVEAMKMQNEMKSPRAGRVADVKAKVDATVAAGEVLLIVE
jgi:biotin carboxyl carrier protein